MPTSSPPAAAQTRTDAPAWSLFGFNVCVGESSAAKRCHLTLPALPHPQPPPPAPPKRLTVMGKTLCFGGTPQHPGCDWQLPQTDAHG